ncbi:hypothetical protein DYGSA30_39590 [Dyella sp. GSA-30]|jgi:hypothetical protein|nr:hypothetical protein DYGSA30_39590 [Dyella sp. GSA-30]
MIASAHMHVDLDSYLPNVPILTASETARLLGYPSTGALAKARQAGRLPIEMFQVPGRRGWFAATPAVRNWLQAITRGASPATNTSTEGKP